MVQIADALAAHPALPGLEQIWLRSRGASSVTVAVIDGPVDLSHPCFRGAALDVVTPAEGADHATSCVAGPASCHHGTHVASVIFGQHRQDSPIWGVAPACRGLIIPVFTDDADVPGAIRPATQALLAAAIDTAREHGADIANISGGQPSPQAHADPRLEQAVQRANEAGMLIVAAAGNDGCDCLHVPAAMQSVLAVGAAGPHGPADFSNFGSTYRFQGLLAPGEAVPGAAPGSGATARSGTSFAAPMVSGVAALMLSLQRGSAESSKTEFRAANLRQMLLASAKPCALDDALACRRYLVGSLDAPRAVQLALRGGTLMPVRPSEECVPEDFTENGSIQAAECQCEQRAAAPPPDTEEEERDEQGAAHSSARTAVSAPPPTARAKGHAPTPSRAVGPAGSAVSLATPARGTSATSEGVEPACECDGLGPLVYTIGEMGFDFGTIARHDAFSAAMSEGFPGNPESLLDFLDQDPTYGPGVIWLLTLNTLPTYAIRPGGAFALQTYERLREFYRDQVNESKEDNTFPVLHSIAGTVSGQARLTSGQVVPVVCPELRGMHNWTTAALVDAACKAADVRGDGEDRVRSKLHDMLNKIYFELQNTGRSPQERALNFAATNIFTQVQMLESLERQRRGENDPDYFFDTIEVERSPICRPDSDCWDVKFMFFDQVNQLTPRLASRFTVDVSDIVPVVIGQPRQWKVR